MPKGLDALSGSIIKMLKSSWWQRAIARTASNEETPKHLLWSRSRSGTATEEVASTGGAGLRPYLVRRRLIYSPPLIDIPTWLCRKEGFRRSCNALEYKSFPSDYTLSWNVGEVRYIPHRYSTHQKKTRFKGEYALDG